MQHPLDSAAGLAASMAQVSLNMSDSCPVFLDMLLHAVVEEGPNNHEDNDEGEEHQTDIQWIPKGLLENRIFQSIIDVTGIDFGIEINI